MHINNIHNHKSYHFMKRILFISVLLFLFTDFTNAQPLSGTHTIGPDPSDDYPSISAAVAALNTNGLGAGGVIFNVVPGHTETISAPISLTVTSGSEANQIIFQKDGAGINPLITAYTGINTPASSVQDGIWNFVGCDYVTVNGIDLNDPNTTNPATMEYGFGFFKANASNGCQNNTIKNCVVSLSYENNEAGSVVFGAISAPGSKAILMVNATVLDQITELIPTGQPGGNSYNIFKTNTLQKCNYGVFAYGYYAAGLWIDKGDLYNEIGGLAASTGNNILNFGGATAATQDAAGIWTRSQYNLIIGENHLDNDNGMGVKHVTTLRGILCQSTTGAFTQITGNYISIKGGGTSSIVNGILSASAGGNTGSIYINDNNISGDYYTATTGNFWGITNLFAATTLQINNNTISNIPYSNGPLTGSGEIDLIYNMSALTNVTVANNTINQITSLGTSAGYMYGIRLSGANITATGNTLSLLTVSGGGFDGDVTGMLINGTGDVVIENNDINNLSTTTGALTGITTSNTCTSENISDNLVTDFTNAIFGCYGIKSEANCNFKTISTNTINNLNSNNDVYGMYVYSGAASILGNKIFDLQTNSTMYNYVTGLELATVSSNKTSNIYNNIIGDLKAPNAVSMDAGSPSIVGLHVPATQTNTNTEINISYNTVCLNASGTGTDFGTASFRTSAGAGSNMRVRNNIFVNKSIPNGAGLAVAFQRSSTTLTDYHSSSNNNVFYAGVPDVSRLVFYDGTNAHQTLAGFQTYIAPRESASLSMDVTFSSINGSDPDFLHINPSASTSINNGGVSIAGITTDFDSESRNATTPDIGADEFNPTFSWTGATNTDWNTASNWSWNGVPIATSNVIITNVTNNPIVNEPVSSPAVCNNLTIELGGVLTINADKALTVNGTLTNNAGNFALFIQSTATGCGSLIHNTNNVNGNIEQFITGNTATNGTMDFHLVSVPLNTVTTAAQYNGMYLFNFNSGTQLWDNVGSNPATVLDNHQGYMLFSPQLNTQIYYSGQLISGEFTTATNMDAEEFSLVPNPYPSAIDWDAVSGWTKSNIYNFFYIWDPVGNNYAAWGSGSGAGSNGIGTAASSKIPVGQSFFVKASGASPVLSMNNSVRVHSTQSFYKQTYHTVPEVLRLNISDSESNDNMIVRFSSEAGNEYENLDVDKLYGSEKAPQLYSLSTGSEKLTINALPHSSSAVVVPLGLEYTLEGQLEFVASGIESFDANASFFLEDKLLNKMIDLKAIPNYTFTHNTSDDIQRFALHFRGVTATGELAAKNYNIWSTIDHVNVHIPALTSQKAIVELYDLLGHQVLSQQVNLGSPTSIAVPQFNGMGIVKVISGGNVYSEKVFIR